MSKIPTKEKKETRERKTPDEASLNARFKEKLKSLKNGRTDKAFAEELGVSRQTVGFWLKGERLPSSLELAKICRITGKSADWFLDISDPNAYSSKHPVKLTSAYTGLSNASVDMLHKLNEAGATDEIATLNYLLERVGFYRLVLSNVRQAILCSKVPDYWADTSDDLSDEEIDLVDRLMKRGYYQLNPYFAVKYLATESGNALTSFIRASIDVDTGHRSEELLKYDDFMNHEYMDAIPLRKEMVENDL